MQLTLRLRKGAALGDAPDTFHLPCALDGVLNPHRRPKGEKGSKGSARLIIVIRASHETNRRADSQEG